MSSRCHAIRRSRPKAWSVHPHTGFGHDLHERPLRTGTGIQQPFREVRTPPQLPVSVVRSNPPGLACRTRTIWQYWSVPSLSGLLPTQILRSTGSRLPSASRARCDEHEAVSFHHRTVTKRLVALDIGHPELVRFAADEVTVDQVRWCVHGADPPSAATGTC